VNGYGGRVPEPEWTWIPSDHIPLTDEQWTWVHDVLVADRSDLASYSAAVEPLVTAMARNVQLMLDVTLALTAVAELLGDVIALHDGETGSSEAIIETILATVRDSAPRLYAIPR
jgi:hypothetical protein